MRLRPLRLGLRTRATISFGVTGLLVAVGLAAVTYTVARSYLVDQRERTAVRQAYVNARLARTVLRSPDADVRAFLAGLGGGTASDSVVRYQGESFSTSVASGPDTIPEDLVRVIADGHAGHQRYRDANGELNLAVGVPLAAANVSYFELFRLDELERTLDLLARSLIVGVAAAAVIAAAVGRAAAGRVVRPLAPVTAAAERLAGGELDTRMVDVEDPDLRHLSVAFNTMAAALEARIEREARFAADVSHELRSPLTAVSAALEIIDRRREQLPPQVIDAFTVLAEKVATFQQTVLDLLEISRLDAGTASLSADSINIEQFISRLLALHDAEDATMVIEDAAPISFTGDRLRLAQALGNIMDNARRYAGGLTRITVMVPQMGELRFLLDDGGQGVPIEERDAIFGRFARGEAGVAAGSTSGTGLGLALAVEHIRLHGGRVWVEDSPEGGARFVVEVPMAAAP